MKKTKIEIRAFCVTFEIELESNKFFTLQGAIKYVKNKFVSTAQVIKVTQMWENGTLIIFNENFINPNQIKFINFAQKYLKTNKDGKS